MAKKKEMLLHPVLVERASLCLQEKRPAPRCGTGGKLRARRGGNDQTVDAALASSSAAELPQ